MHELPITQSLVDMCIKHGEQAGATKVTALHLVIGDLASVVDESVQFYWDIVSKDTICEGAELLFERIPAQFACLECGNEYSLSNGELTGCPLCGSIRIKTLRGAEFRLESIDIETE
jgi:hydrogenase nickel incorporation protein HypA/HybF